MIIHSLLDTDLYKFTMMQVVLHHFPAAHAEYKFRCRTQGVDLVPYIDEIREEVRALCQLRFTEDELEYLRRMRFIKSDFIDFLALFHLNEKSVTIKPSERNNGEIDIDIVGPWLHTILFEIPVLAIVNEVYFRNTQRDPTFETGRDRLRDKIQLLGGRPEVSDCKIADYGTRRRFSGKWHEEVILKLKEGLGEQFTGTSNVYYAMKHGLRPLGTMAHEYLQACQALGPRLRDSQVFGFEMWAKEYRGDLGIALSDVYGMKAFLNDFDMYFCKLFDGARHDSGDPFDWGERLIRHYEQNRCDPRTKAFAAVASLPLAWARISPTTLAISRCRSSSRWFAATASRSPNSLILPARTCAKTRLISPICARSSISPSLWENCSAWRASSARSGRALAVRSRVAGLGCSL